MRRGVGSGPADPDDRERVRQLVSDLGVVGASERLGISRQTMISIIAGLDVRAGTLALLRQSLRRLSVDEKDEDVSLEDDMM